MTQGRFIQGCRLAVGVLGPRIGRRHGLWLAAMAALVATGPAAASFHDSASRSAGDLVIQLAIVPATFALEHTPEHTGDGMHGGPPPSRYSHHLIVAVFEARGGARIADAKVTAVVSSNRRPVGLLTLEPMAFGGAATYGGFVEMPPRDSYRISVEVRRAEGTAPVKADFWHRHWQP